MKPWETVERAQVPEVGEVVLARRDEEYVLRVRGQLLMSSRQHGSETAMAEAGCEHLPEGAPARVLVGGLGFGFTVRAVLDRLTPGARVVVAELMAPVVAWNRGVLAPLANSPLEDPRVTVVEGDVGKVMRKQQGAFDAILLDVDNGPAALTHPDNGSLYDLTGVSWAFNSLRSNGTLVVWSAGPSPAFVNRLEEVGFTVRLAHPTAHGTKGTRHTLFVARRVPKAAASKGPSRR
jgi:spermidine synthase